MNDLTTTGTLVVVEEMTGRLQLQELNSMDEVERMADEAVAIQKPKAPRVALESRKSMVGESKSRKSKVGLAKKEKEEEGREGSNRESSRIESESSRVGRKREKDGEICLGDRNGLTF